MTDDEKTYNHILVAAFVLVENENVLQTSFPFSGN